MTPGVAAMMLGTFAVPAVLLWMGHRLRRRSNRWRSAFWGALLAHVIAMPVAAAAAMYPAAEWAPTDVVRGALGLWSMLVAPLIGGAVGWVAARRTER